MKAIITVGVSASGKTTWAQEFIYEQNLASRKAAIDAAVTDSEREEALLGNVGGSWTNINRDNVREAIMREKGEGIFLEGLELEVGKAGD